MFPDLPKRKQMLEKVWSFDWGDENLRGAEFINPGLAWQPNVSVCSDPQKLGFQWRGFWDWEGNNLAAHMNTPLLRPSFGFAFQSDPLCVAWQSQMDRICVILMQFPLVLGANSAFVSCACVCSAFGGEERTQTFALTEASMSLESCGIQCRSLERAYLHAWMYKCQCNVIVWHLFTFIISIVYVSNLQSINVYILIDMQIINILTFDESYCLLQGHKVRADALGTWLPLLPIAHGAAA